MENNIEDLIRNDFRKREIQPNANAFERLHTKLDAQKVYKHKNLIRILGYAASFIGLVFILQFVFKTNTGTKEIITNVKVKDAAQTQINKENTHIAVEQLEAPINKPLTIKKLRKEVATKEIVADNSQRSLPSKVSEHKIIQKELIASRTVDTEKTVFNDTTKKQLRIKEVTDEELDALLASASQSLTKRSRDSIAINAQSMLYELEVEINKPLPEKVLLTLKTGAVTIKELVRSNNNKENK